MLQSISVCRGIVGFSSCFVSTQVGLTHGFVCPREKLRFIRHSGHFRHPVKAHGRVELMFLNDDSTLRSGPLGIGLVVRDNSLRCHSVAVSSKLWLHPVRGPVVPLTGRRTLRGGRSMRTRSPGCTSIRNWTFSSKSFLHVLCAAARLCPAFSME